MESLEAKPALQSVVSSSNPPMKQARWVPLITHLESRASSIELAPIDRLQLCGGSQIKKYAAAVLAVFVVPMLIRILLSLG